MHPTKGLIRVAGLALGGLGIVACIVAMVLLWMASSRFGRVTEGLFRAIDHPLVVVRQRVVQTRARVSGAKITLADIEQSFRDWSIREVGEQLALRQKAEKETQRLVSSLQQADEWLEASADALGLVKRVVSTRMSTDPSDKTTSLDQLGIEIAALRNRLVEATELVERTHTYLVEAGEGPSREERRAQAIEFAVRVVATLGTIDARFEQLADRLSVARGELQQLATTTNSWTLTATLGLTLLMLWMAAGQVALCRLAWND